MKTEIVSLHDNPAQPMQSTFGLYKCGQSGQMLMGFSKDEHVKKVHKGKDVQWEKMK